MSDRPLAWLRGEVKTPPFSAAANWRIVYRLDPDAVVIVDVFSKKTAQLPKTALDGCRARLRRYDATIELEDGQ